MVSLHGLLDYDESDTDGATMELSLAAEALQDMFSRDYGTAILNALIKERCGPSGCDHSKPPNRNGHVRNRVRFVCMTFFITVFFAMLCVLH